MGWKLIMKSQQAKQLVHVLLHVQDVVCEMSECYLGSYDLAFLLGGWICLHVDG